MSGSRITASGLEKTYHRGGESLCVLDHVDFDIAEGEFVALTGPSGSGKSTILHFVGGLDHPDGGSIVVGDTEVSALSKSKLAEWRSQNVGFIFQSFNLLPVLTAIENVELPLILQPLSKSQRREKAEFALEIVGLQDRMTHRPKELSGGQEQRVAIARAIVTDPDVILADEPTGDLDRVSADQILDILKRLSTEHNKTIIMVTHDPAAAAYADRVLSLDKGQFVEGAGK
ncbi:MAG: putative ABC transport system ATP-binding protein [Planctomycetota bacterium]|jgi:putative ABC transport system ATP-binding protein